MSLSRVKVWSNGEVLSATDLNGEFNNILNYLNGAMTLPGTVTVSGQLIGKGTATNDSAAAGYIGEIISASVLIGAAISLTLDSPANITSISLTAGDWDVSGAIWFTGGATTTVTYLVGAVSATSATLPTRGDSNYTSNPHGGATLFNNAAAGYMIGPYRVSLASTTTYYLVTQAGFATSTCSGFGIIRARRVR